jgi:hypothetical protein
VSAPTFWLDEDGRHVWWKHDCNAPWASTPGFEMRIPINDIVGWTVQSTDPITLSPSLLCSACGEHGFIRDGKWVPA